MSYNIGTIRREMSKEVTVTFRRLKDSFHFNRTIELDSGRELCNWLRKYVPQCSIEMIDTDNPNIKFRRTKKRWLIDP